MITRWVSSYSSGDGNCVEVEGNFRTSRHSMSNGNCLEAGNDFRKSTYSGSNGNCIEIADGILVRDTKQNHLGEARTVIRFTESAWREFTERLKKEVA